MVEHLLRGDTLYPIVSDLTFQLAQLALPRVFTSCARSIRGFPQLLKEGDMASASGCR